MELSYNNNLTLINEPDIYGYNYPTGRGRSVQHLPFASPATIDLINNWAVMEDLTTGTLESVPPPLTEKYNWAKVD